MTTLKKYFIIAVFVFAVVPMHGMQKGLGYLRGKAYETFNPAILEDYETLGLNANATDEEVKDAYKNLSLVHHPDKGGDRNEFEKVHDAKRNIDAHVKNRTFFDLYIAGCLLIGTAATVAGLIKAWKLYKEYSSPNAILLEKIELAANKAVTLILNLEFDRYNPTKDTDTLCLQFDLEPLFAQLSPEVCKQVKQAVIAFDKTLEATYEQCAWHYDGMMPEELVMKNPRLVYAMRTKLELLLEALELCKTDLQLDRNKPLEFLKAHYKKMIGLGVAGSLGWYGVKKLMAMQNAPQAQPAVHLLGARRPQI